MKLIAIRIESILKEQMQKMADIADSHLSDIVRDLIDLGIGYREEAPIIIEGAFGISRSFSKLSFGDERTRISAWVEEEQIKKAMDAFQSNENGSLREAIRLGFIMLHADSVRLKNPLTEMNPFSAFKLTKFKNERAQEAYETLREGKNQAHN